MSLLLTLNVNHFITTCYVIDFFTTLNAPSLHLVQVVLILKCKQFFRKAAGTSVFKTKLLEENDYLKKNLWKKSKKKRKKIQ